MGYPAGTQLFGAHGQPLGPIPPQHSPPQHAPQQQHLSPSSAPYEYPAPSPTSSYSSFADDRGPSSTHSHAQEQSRKRPQQDPHPSILPPPMPGQPYPRSESAGTRRQAVEDDLKLPPVTPTGGSQTAANYSPGSSTSSHSNLQPPQPSGHNSLSRTPPPRSSPAEGRSDPMSLGSIMERRPDTEIDRSMLGRLDRKN